MEINIFILKKTWLNYMSISLIFQALKNIKSVVLMRMCSIKSYVNHFNTGSFVSFTNVDIKIHLGIVLILTSAPNDVVYAALSGNI